MSDTRVTEPETERLHRIHLMLFARDWTRLVAFCKLRGGTMTAGSVVRALVHDFVKGLDARLAENHRSVVVPQSIDLKEDKNNAV